MLPALLAGGAALVVGLACGAYIFGTGGESSPGDQTDDAARTPMPPASAPPPPATPRSQGGTDVAEEPPPPEVTFVDVAGARLPVSPTAGPWDMDGGLARGFSRDRAGAALAAAHILIRIHPEVGADVFDPTLAEQVVGPYADALAANVRYGYEQLLHRWPATYGQPAGSLHLRAPGYRIDEFTDDEATVQLLLEVPHDGGSLLGTIGLRMSWQEDDWALMAPVDGAFTGTSLVEDTSGFALWSEETP